MLFDAADMTPQSGAPETKAVTKAVSSFGEAISNGNTGNNCSSPVSAEGGGSEMHANNSVTAHSKQMIVTGGVSLRLDCVVPKRTSKREESCSCGQLLKTACLQTNNYCKQDAWHEQDDDHDHVWLLRAITTCNNLWNKQRLHFPNSKSKSLC